MGTEGEREMDREERESETKRVIKGCVRDAGGGGERGSRGGTGREA